VSAPGAGLVVASPGRPVQAVVEGVLVVAVESEEPSDFSQGERDQATVGGGCLLGFDRGWVSRRGGFSGSGSR
jgi:hypothetical protein